MPGPQSLNSTPPRPAREVSLLVLAAGLGSRFGGDKQLVGLGPANMPLMYYNLMDAHAAGIRHAVLILREELIPAVEREFLPHLPGDLRIELALQAIDKLPRKYPIPDRSKPWGTGHALWCARETLTRPFITVNADDYYGPGALQTMVDHFQDSDDWALACYRLASTLSPHGGVNRGLCTLRDGYLTDIEECLQIHRQDNKLLGKVGSAWRELPEATPVSMNLWGFTPALVEQLERGLRLFLDSHSGDSQMEFLLPEQVLVGITGGTAKVRALHSDDRWLGITYPDDLALVDAALIAQFNDDR